MKNSLIYISNNTRLENNSKRNVDKLERAKTAKTRDEVQLNKPEMEPQNFVSTDSPERKLYYFSQLYRQ